MKLQHVLRAWSMQATHGTFATERYPCVYHVWGRGPALVCVHGAADDAMSFAPLQYLLSKSVRTITYDLPRDGSKGSRSGGYRLADFVTDLVGLLDHLNIQQCAVLGSSYGSTIALEAMRTHPQRFTRGILQGGFARRPLAPAERILAKFARYFPGTMSRLPGRQALLNQAHYAPFENLPEERWQFLLERWGATPIRTLAHRVLHLDSIDLRGHLSSIPQETLLISGDADPLVDRACQDVLMTGLPNAAEVELKNCGHNPLFTHPEIMAEVVERFLVPSCLVGEAHALASCNNTQNDV